MALKIESNTWCWVFISMDTMFFIDMVMSFFTSYQPGGDEEEQTNRKEIAIHYLRTWFILDLFAILPFDLIFSSLSGAPKLCGLGVSILDIHQ